MSFTGCRFDSNTATLTGGAVCDRYSRNSYTGCTFAYNQAPTGGALTILGDDIPFPMTGVVITGSTFAYNEATVGSSVAFSYANLWEFELRNCLVVFGTGGEAINITGPGTPLLSCTDIYGNAGGDWSGSLASLLGVDGNLSVDPGFCGEQAESDPFALEAGSPCAAGNNPVCGQIGVRPVGCDGLPAIESVSDVAADQGGWVTVTWRRCGYDRVGSTIPVTDYGIYRAQADSLDSRQLAGQPRKTGGWDLVEQVAAAQCSTYQVVAPTICDSTISLGPCDSIFMVSALTADPGIHFNSPPEVGHSLDNLSPAAPAAFSVDYRYDRNQLTWEHPGDGDLLGFRIYRMLSPADPPGDNAVPTTTLAATTWSDPMPTLDSDAWQYRYWLAAVDSAGNSSGLVGPTDVSGVTEPGIPPRTILYDNAPNPFNPATIIRFDLAAAARVDLQVFDLTGRLVVTLINGEDLLPGRHQSLWHGLDQQGRAVASGLYFCRLRAGSQTQTQGMLLLK